MKGWEAMRVTAPDTCRPFSRDRRGLVIGEGAAVIVLETLDHARSRSATILGEIVGFGMSADAGDLLSPDESGMVRAIESGLADAGLSPDDIQYVNAHGTGTAANDETETKAIKRAFGNHAARLAISSNKSMVGHALGAAGGLELVLACDFAWAAESARIGDMHINFAQIGGAGAMARLPRLIGQSRAIELVSSGRLLDSTQAQQWGLVNRVVADDQLLEAGLEFARSVAAKSPTALHFMKSTIRGGMERDLPGALRLERDQALRYCLTLPDSMEGIAAFIEKRTPVYGAVR